MNPTTPAAGLPVIIDSAVQRMKHAARMAVERAVDSLGVAALDSSNFDKREQLLGAQFELSRKLPNFCRTFDTTLDSRVEREVTAHGSTRAAPVQTSWDALSLVDDNEMEIQVSAERFGMQIAQGCEEEQRELEALISSVLHAEGGETPRNPLRPDVIGNAMLRSVDQITDRAELRKLLVVEIQRALATAMPQTYAQIVADFRAAGVKPAELVVRPSDAQRTGFGRTHSGHDTLGRADGVDSLAQQFHDGAPSTRSGGRFDSSTGAGSIHSRSGQLSAQGQATRPGTPIGQIDAGLMLLIRRLAELGQSGQDSAFLAEDALLHTASGTLDGAGRLGVPVAPNLIHKHRDALRRASNGSLDHMVIDVIGSLFDQILSDPKVPPQMARQIARLQLPVLRAALGDPSFFSSRKHPVRRFVNRIASIGCGFDDLESEPGRHFVKLIQELVQEVVDGDFDQIEVYEQKLSILEAFVVEQTRREVQENSGADALLAEREMQLRLQQRFAQQMQILLAPLPIADFVRDFVSQVWSQALMHAARLDGENSARLQRFRHAGRELIMSVQPKGSPAMRKTFLQQLPTLMKELNEGMDLIGWPEAAKKAFFGRLLPAHAESLKSPPISTLDYNMLVKAADAALGEPLPNATELSPPRGNVPVLRDEVILPNFSAEERQRIGLIDESTVNWDGKVDIELGMEPEPDPTELEIAGLPKMEAATEPASGKSLADHVQIGFAYQMHLEDKWQKVRLNHVSPGRSFFVFTHGGRHKKTISMTHRMLVRLCETGRLRAFENGYLIERATARARRQLAALGDGTAAVA
jgi:hypothetical protein